MKISGATQTLFFGLFFVAVSLPSLSAQIDKPPSPQAPLRVDTSKLPLSIQLKKSIVFVETSCLLKVSAQDEINVSPDALSKLNDEQRARLRDRLKTQTVLAAAGTSRLKKLSKQDSDELLAPAVDTLPLPEFLRLLSKAIDLTQKEFDSMSQPELDLLPRSTTMGTAFFVGVTEPTDQRFVYLVTNRHVVQPGIEEGKPCQVLNYSVWINKLHPDSPPVLETDRMGNKPGWILPNDDSIDLAVVPANPDGYDALFLPEELFVSEEMVAKYEVVEGDPVLFTGLFIQSFLEVHRLEPIVRSGTLAMLPGVPMLTTLKKPGKIYFTEAHAFHGNSGSPVLVDTAKFTNRFGSDFKVLGVLSGEVFEGADFNLQVASTIQGVTAANSDISIVVPISQLKAILHSPELQAGRDRWLKTHPAAK